MGDMGDAFKAMREDSKARRSVNREGGAILLRCHGIDFESKNDGAHLIVQARGHTIDFWPGTGLWRMRGSTQRHRGAKKLVAFCKAAQSTKEN